MAVLRTAAVSFLVPSNQFPSCRTKPPRSVSASNSASFPSNLTRRKNHLRIKILKTLTKPYPFTSTPSLPGLPPADSAAQIVAPEISVPTDVATQLPSPAKCHPSSAADGDGVETSGVVESSNAATQLGFGAAGFSWGSVIRFGVYFVAVFAFQTICTVFVLGYGNSIKDDRNSDERSTVQSASRREVILNGNEKIELGKFGSKTSLVYSDESKMRRKIEEIRSMAREARSEEKNRTSDDSGAEGTERRKVISKTRIGIEKEVDARLVKLQKRLNSARGKMEDSQSHVNYLLKSEKVEDTVERDRLNVDEGNEALMFKKKFKYRSSSNESVNKPKGFQGLTPKRRKRGSNGKVTVVEDINFVGDDEIVNSSSQTFKDDEANSERVWKQGNDGKKSSIGTKGTETSPSNGVVPKTSSIEMSKPESSRKLEAENSQSSSKENQETSTSAVPLVVSSSYSSVGKESMAHEGRSRQSNKETDLWWFNLPHVLVILMRRGFDDELGGLFTLKIPSEAPDLKDSTYTVAFEDRVDANNFCYLLESFFEDLGDFAADILPVPTKELENFATSRTSNIIVVKKGQLQLYAGQPFTDVEMALYDLVKQR